MPSKYDAFWEQREADLMRLLHEAYMNGRSLLAVPELRAVGERQHWSASLSVADGEVRTSHAVHAKSLGRVLARLSHMYPDASFRVRITDNLLLQIRRAETAPEGSRGHASSPSMPTERARQAPALAPGGDSDPAGRGDAAQVAQRIHELIWRLPRYTELPPRSALPTDGIYFWFERGEGSETHPRIVRVGINRSPGRFWERIKQHYRGNRRGSAFRHLIGDALLRRQGQHVLWQEWHDRNGPRLPEIENEVSRLLAERFSFAYIAVDNDGERRRLENWLISCLTRGRWPAPSPEWLGNHCSRPEVRESGLWNIAGVGAEHSGEDDRLLARLEELTEGTLRVRTRGAGNAHTGTPEVLLIIPCSSSKVPPSRPLFARDECRRILDFLPKTGRFLAEGRAGKEDSVRKHTPLLAALDYYSGYLYQAAGLKQNLAKALQQNRLEVVILSGGYGIVLADECIHEYDARMNAAYWTRHRLPEVVREFIARRGFRRVYAVAARTTDYATILQRVPWTELSGQLDEAILCTIADTRGRDAPQSVPRALGEVVRTLIEANFNTRTLAGQTIDGLVVACYDMLRSL